MNQHRLPFKILFGIGSLLGLALHPASAQTTGQKVYEKTCITCHGTGLADAPKLGDKKTWGPLLKEPQYQLTAHGYVGVRAMPAKGGQADLSVEDFAKAVVYMAQAAGSRWTDPDAKLLAKINQEVTRRERELKIKKTTQKALNYSLTST
jgi:cytochrome c5